MRGLHYLSPSQIGTLLRCEMQYYFRYIEGIKSPPSGAMIVGTGAHKAQEKALIAKMREESAPKTAELVELAVDSVDREFDRGEVKLDGDDTPATIRDNAAIAARTTIEQITPKIKEPVAVEEKRTITIGDHGVDLTAIPDVEEFGRVCDLKIRKTAPNPSEELQVPAYAYLHWHDYNVLPEFRFDVVSLLKSGVKVREVVARPTERDINFFFTLFDRAVERIRAGRERDDWVPRPSGWHCSEKWCGYWNLCRGGRDL